MKLGQNIFQIKNPHLTHFCKHSQEHSNFLTNLNDYDYPRFQSSMITSRNNNSNSSHDFTRSINNNNNNTHFKWKCKV